VDFFQAFIVRILNIVVENSLKSNYLLLNMCGIFFYKYLSGQKVDVNKTTAYFNRIKHRGPDKSVSEVLDEDTFIGFHRLAINGLTEMGDQPFIYEKESGAHVYVICNGEIYNYRELNEKYELELEEGESDCAVIYPLFEKLGLEKMINLLDAFSHSLFMMLRMEVFMLVATQSVSAHYFTAQMKIRLRFVVRVREYAS